MEPTSAGHTPAQPRRLLDRAVARRAGFDVARAESRVSAYVYGNVLVLAAVFGASAAAVVTGTAVVLVVGTVLSTYVAHVLAHSIGSLLGAAGDSDRSAVGQVLRDAVPIVSSGVTPAVLLAATALGWLPGLLGQSLASAVLLLRIAGTGLVYRRLRADVSPGRALWVGCLAAAVAALAVVLKLTLTH